MPNKILTSFIICLFHSTSLYAAYECVQGEAVRKIEVTYPEAGKKVPCGVKYTKEDKSEKEVANAKAEEGVCEQKAKTLSEKLTGFGWACSEK